MPKRKSSDERRGDNGGAAKRPALQRKHHLYLVLDDWESGYSVHKLDADTFDSADATGDDLPPPPAKRFTDPPVARIEAEHVNGSDCNFVSHGTKIFAMQPGEASPAIPSFDTRTLGLSLYPWPSSSNKEYGLPFFASAAGKLFVFTDTFRAVYLDAGNNQPPYAWATMEARWPPFYASQVTCYALHPDGSTLFVSAASRAGGPRSGTFSLDTERLEWTRHGDWLLPFSGQAHFDAELEAWVGLFGGERDKAGRLCSCDVAPVAAEFTSPPSWKLGEDQLFRRNPELHLGAKLVYMGHSKFCLVELLFHKDDAEHLRSDREGDPDASYYNSRPRRRRVLDMTTFGLKYNKEGKLRTTLQRARACRMYKVPDDAGRSLKPLAFWL